MGWLTATEFTDTPPVLEDKVEWLLALLKISSKTVIYTGAGISTAAGVEQAARGGRSGTGCSTDARPTTTHRALAALHEVGLAHSWVQQNHDGLPQKAGYPQEDIVEIHGSWYDPSNPVVCYDGNLKPEYFQRMKEDADSADLVLVLGTSLSGLNSDRVAIRYRDTLHQAGPGQGKVMSYSSTQGGWVLEVEGVQMLLGGWWLPAAVRGKLEFVPVINIEPVMGDSS